MMSFNIMCFKSVQPYTYEWVREHLGLKFRIQFREIIKISPKILISFFLFFFFFFK